jgi:hypothetical protein
MANDKDHPLKGVYWPVHLCGIDDETKRVRHLHANNLPRSYVLAPNLDWRQRLPWWDVREWPVMEDDDEGVKFVRLFVRSFVIDVNIRFCHVQ